MKRLLFLLVALLALAGTSSAIPPMPPTSLPTTCTNGQIAVWNSTTSQWDTCADLSGGGDMLASVYVTSGKIKTATGGTGIDSSGSTGTAYVTAGTWSVPNAATMRTNLGLVIGTNVQAYDADLTTYAGITPSANVQSLLGAADYAAMKVLLGLTVGTDVQAYSANLQGINQGLSTTGTPTFASATLTATSSLALGTGSSATGQVVFSNATNNNTLTVQSGTQAASRVLSLVGSGGNYSLTVSGNSTINQDVSSTANATFGTVNKLTLTAPATGATLTIADGKVFTVSNTLTIAGTDSSVITFPAASGTVAYAGTMTNGKICTANADGKTVDCNTETPTGLGTITAVGDITTGAAFTVAVPGKTLVWNNATSGTVTLQAQTGALGTVTVALPAASGTLVVGPANVPVSIAGPTAARTITVADNNFTVSIASGKALTLAGSLTTSGAYDFQFTVPGAYTYTLPGATSTLAILGANSFTAEQAPATNDGASLGDGTHAWSDLFLASGGVINWNNGNATLTHSTGLLTSNVPFTVGTSNAITTGTIELGATSDTTLSRSSAGVLAVEGVTVSLNATTATHTAGTIELGAATDTTLSRVSAGVMAVESVNVLVSTATGVQTFLTTPSSANFASMITNETGSGVVVFGTSPSFTTDIRAATAGGATIGTAALPFSSVYIGDAGTNNIQLTGTAASAKVITLPGQTGTVTVSPTTTTALQVYLGTATAGLGQWSTLTMPATITAGSVFAANSANVLAAINSTSGTKFLQNADGVISWATGVGTIAGSTGATDNRLIRSDGTGGVTIQSSAITVDDSGNVSGVGTLSAGAAGFTVDADGDTVAKSLTVTKVSGSAGDLSLYEANSTDTDAAGLRGPVSLTANTSYRGQFPNAKPTSDNMVLAWAQSASGSGTPSDPYISAMSFVDLDNYALLAGATFTGKVITPVVSGANEGLNIGQSAGAPSGTPNNGAVWMTASGMYAQYAGSTNGPFLTGTVVDDTAYAGSWDGVTATAPSKNAVYDKMQLVYAGGIAIASQAAGDTITASSGTQLSRVAKGTAYQVFHMNSGATAPEWTSTLGVTGTRLTKVWATDIESTNMPTVGGTAILTSLTAPQFTTIELGHASDTTIARSGAGAITVEGVQVILSGAALGTPASGTLTNCTGLPVSGITASTSTALGVGSVELGHASDTTLARVSAGVVSIEGVNIVTTSSTDTLTNKTLTAPAITMAEVDGHTDQTALTAAQVSNTEITNYNQGAGDVFLLLPAAVAGYSFLANVATAQSNHFGVEAGASDKIYLIAADGTIAAGDDGAGVVMTAAQAGQQFACWTFKTGATAYDWACKAIAIGTSTFAAHAHSTP